MAENEYYTRLVRKDRKNVVGKKQHEEGSTKVGIRFRCDFPSTQVKVMLARGWKQVVDPDDNGWHLWWCETNDVRQALDAKKLEPYQRIPHFRNHYELTRKNYLCRNLKRYKKLLTKAGKLAEAELCDSMPITFELPSEYRMFVEEYQKQPGSTWIVKPVGRSQGRGIFLFRRLKDLIDWRSRNNSPNQQTEMSTETFVVQKYIDDPYLLAGRKFDLRIYVLVTSFHPLKVWLAREGFARLSSVLFDLKNINDNRVHLTNMAIQLKRSKVEEDRPKDEHRKRRCKWSLLKFREYLTARHGVSVVEAVLQRIAGKKKCSFHQIPFTNPTDNPIYLNKKSVTPIWVTGQPWRHTCHPDMGVIMASLLAVQRVMMQGRNNSFELYGYDVILDEKLTPWLLEVNASPSLSATDTEDYRLKFDLIDDVLNVVDLERRFTAREIRIGGLDLLWHDGPVWTSYPNPTICGKNRCYARKLNVFLGARNDRPRQLRRLHEILQEMRAKRSDTALKDSPPNDEHSRQ